MCEVHKYKLQISDSLNGSHLDFKQFPELQVIYLSSQNSLCPSNYSNIVCFWEGDINLTLEVNGEKITLNDHDKKNDRKIKVQDYEFQGLEPIVENRSKDQTYLVLSIKKCSPGKENVKRYNLHQPFILEFGDNPSTGYTWKATTTPGLEIVSSIYSDHCEYGLAGCGGMRTFVLRGIARGRQRFTGTHGQSWTPETMNPIIHEFDII